MKLLKLNTFFILFFSFLTFNCSCFVDPEQEPPQTAYSTNYQMIDGISNDYVVYYDSNHFTNYQFITNLTNYKYFIKEITNFVKDYENSIIINSNSFVEITTNYYFTNTLVTNYSIISTTLSTNNNLIDWQIK